MTTSTNGTTWSSVVRIPIDGTNSGVDHFIPGLAVDNTTSGSTAKLALAYYYYPTASCSCVHLQAQRRLCLVGERRQRTGAHPRSWPAP